MAREKGVKFDAGKHRTRRIGVSSYTDNTTRFRKCYHKRKEANDDFIDD